LFLVVVLEARCTRVLGRRAKRLGDFRRKGTMASIAERDEDVSLIDVGCKWRTYRLSFCNSGTER